jgi:hypothetical protein
VPGKEARTLAQDGLAEQDSAAKMAGWQVQMAKDPGNGRWTLESGDNFQGATAVGAVNDIDRAFLVLRRYGQCESITS